jgi:hypothetical protein
LLGGVGFDTETRAADLFTRASMSSTVPIITRVEGSGTGDASTSTLKAALPREPYGCPSLTPSISNQ